jgi:hypothetical protein
MNTKKHVDWKACEVFWSDVTESFVCPIQMDEYAFDVSHTERTTIEEAKAISEKIVRAVNNYEPIRQRIQELEDALSRCRSLFVHDKDIHLLSLQYNIIEKIDKALQSSKQL